MNGFVLIDKPAGISSFGVVSRVRWLLSQYAGRKVKVGHTGTLDPFATGLMIVVVGDYCKRAAEFSKLDKTYEARLILGQQSTTGDPEGELEKISDRQPSADELKTALTAFTGEIDQTPPGYSAIKINGVRAYKLARAGKTPDMPSRKVTVHFLDLVAYEYPYVTIRTSVSSGTYIRTLAEDIGRKLGTGAYTSSLRRIGVGKYTVTDAVLLDAIVTGSEIKFLSKEKYSNT